MLKNTILDFVNELIELYPDKIDLVLFKLYVSQQEEHNIKNFFKDHIIPNHETIKTHDIDSLHDIFKQNYNNHEAISEKVFKLWYDMQADTQEIVWEWIDTFIILASK